MWSILVNLIRKRLGYHVCEEFTQWEIKSGHFTKTPMSMGLPILTLQRTIFKRWQERKCTVCGIIQQRELDQ